MREVLPNQSESFWHTGSWSLLSLCMGCLVLGVIGGWLIVPQKVPETLITYRRIEVPVDRIVEKRVEVPVKRVVEVYVQIPVDRVSERRVEVPVDLVTYVDRVLPERMVNSKASEPQLSDAPRQAWRNLTPGMTTSAVRSLLGSPQETDGLVYASWYYGHSLDDGYVFFQFDKVSSWREPSR